MGKFVTMMILGLAAVLSLVATPGHAALSNSNNPHVMCIPLGSPSVDATILGGYSYGKKLVVSHVALLNGANIAASDTDFVQLELRKGATVVAELDSRAAHENGIASSVIEPLNIVAAESTIAANSVLSVVYNETDAGTNVALTGAVLCMHYVVK